MCYTLILHQLYKTKKHKVDNTTARSTTSQSSTEYQILPSCFEELPYAMQKNNLQ